MHAVGNLILLNVGLILQLEHVVGDLHSLPDLVNVHKRVADHAALRHLVFRFVLFVGRADFHFIR